MITIRRQLLGLGFVAASSLLALHSANALSGPTAIAIDGGPLGSLNLSGGVDGYAYGQTGNDSNALAGSNGGNSVGAYVGSALVELQKTTGLLQFTIEIGSNGGTHALGTGGLGVHSSSQTSVNVFSTGPLYAGYLTLAPASIPGLTISGGQVPSLEGFESGVDWNNANQLTTEIFYVQNSQSRGVEATYATGPVSGTVVFGDGYDSGVWNYIQAAVTYTINSTNSVYVYGAANLGTTGPNAQTFVGTGNGAALYSNSDMIGAFYNLTLGSLNLVPEVQYQETRAIAKIGLTKPASNFGAAVFADYSFGTSPYSIGSWIEAFTSHTGAEDQAVYIIGPDAQGVGASITPTWQYKYLFARADVGGFYLLHNKSNGVSYGYGSGNNGKGVFTGELEAGLLF